MSDNKGTLRELRHKIVRQVRASGIDFDLQAQATRLLEGRAGLSRKDQRDRFKQVRDILTNAGYADDGSKIKKALKNTDRALKVLKERKAEAKKEESELIVGW